MPCKFGGVHVEVVLDSGANQSVMCPRFVEKLEAAGIWMTRRALGKEVGLALSGRLAGSHCQGSQGGFRLLDICGKIAVEKRGVLRGGCAVGDRPG